MEEWWLAVICPNSSCLKKVRQHKLPKCGPRAPQGKSSWKYCNVDLGFKSVKEMQDETQVEVSDL